jgi:hemolysin III
MLGCFAAYNLWPVSSRKWLLRRLDRLAILLFIAATYTPLIAHLEADKTRYALLVVVWVARSYGRRTPESAISGPLQPVSIGFCLVLGCSGLLILLACRRLTD